MVKLSINSVRNESGKPNKPIKKLIYESDLKNDSNLKNK